MDLDVLFVHAPAIYDFRDRDDVLFAYLGNSDSEHVSSVYEMPPVGMLALDQMVRRLGRRSRFFNVASRMLRDPGFDVAEFFRRVSARYIALDLHWVVHAHGSLELAALYRRMHPGAKSLLGGMSATYFHQELLGYEQVDYVLRGYDTLGPLERLLLAEDDPVRLREVPNLSWKDGGSPVHNPMTHVPRTYSAAVDWSEVLGEGRANVAPYSMIIPQAGCEYNCTWCGGGRHFFRQHMGLERGPSRVPKPVAAFRTELQSVAGSTPARQTVASIDFWHEHEDLFAAAESVYVDHTGAAGPSRAGIATVHYSLHRLPPVEKAKRMARHIQAIVELSPDSHDLEVAKASGRGVYTMEEMEAFIDRLLDDVHAFEIYFMIGLPKQTVQSVLDTAAYCEHLLTKYQGRRVIPFIRPMLPFLDPGSPIADAPEEYGYRLFHVGLEAHRTALIRRNWRDSLNYETRWLSRDELLAVSYEAVRRLMVAKARHRQMPQVLAKVILRRIDETRALLADVDAWERLPEGPERRGREPGLKERIRRYNREQLGSPMSQQRPIDVQAARRHWYETDEAFDEVMR